MNPGLDISCQLVRTQRAPVPDDAAEPLREIFTWLGLRAAQTAQIQMGVCIDKTGNNGAIIDDNIRSPAWLTING